MKGNVHAVLNKTSSITTKTALFLLSSIVVSNSYTHTLRGVSVNILQFLTTKTVGYSPEADLATEGN